MALRPPVGERRIELQRGQEAVSAAILPVAQSNDPDVALAACRQGGGIAALPKLLAAEDARSGALQIVFPGRGPHAPEILVVYSAQVAPPPPVQAFLDQVFDTLGKEKPWEAW